MSRRRREAIAAKRMGCFGETVEPRRFDIAVWNHEGDIIEKVWDATYEDLDEIEAKYRDEPLLTVVVEER